ncbi:hypothetical protein [Methanoregula sp.]|uniref:hypothetical protein n=1 Tax=Methanoregula sp. TaxID=2052170 RepID=UPI000CBFB17D|nr:hypothetical protein [Methanoregula sp.]PKG32831.1 MAG: hypothetical protein CW742_06080 [Methanoregula sp.]
MLSRSPCPARHVAGIEKMQTENSKNEMNRIHEDRGNEDSRIAGLGRGAGYNDGAVSMSPVSQEEQNMDQTEKPEEVQKITRELMRKPSEEQATPMDQTEKPEEVQKITRELMRKPSEEQATPMDQTEKPEEVQKITRELMRKPSEEQATPMDQTEKPEEVQKITRELMRNPHEEQATPMDRSGKSRSKQNITMEHSAQPREEQTTPIDRTGKPPEATGHDTPPDQNKRPVVAIREAKRRAVIWGFTVADVVSDDVLPYDFIAMKDGITSFVRIRRIRDSWFDSKIVQERCRNEIAGFRAMKQQPELIFELWIRGYARAFHRYRIRPDAIEKIGIVLEPETRAGIKALDEERRAGTIISKNDDRGRVVRETVMAISDPGSP